MVVLSTSSDLPRDKNQIMPLHNLPYDLLLNISQYLDLLDIYALQLTCKTLHEFTITRPVYRNLAHALLRRCRPLPLAGFQRLSDLTTEQLVQSVAKATRFEKAWRDRAPRPIAPSDANDGKWYKVVSAPPNEEVDWLSPITSSYTLCATKSGKVVCWDVTTDQCLSEWNPGEKWELWKCRVEFDQKAVYFTMAKLLSDSGLLTDERVMEFILMRLSFSDGDPESEGYNNPGGSPPTLSAPFISPVFSQITSFKTAGVVMNVFLLDPPGRLLACFVWVPGPNSIGLYTLLDWDTQEYVFIDTGIECLPSSNWSCILYDEQIVIHSEESDAAYQHFYPISFLNQHKRKISTRDPVPALSAHVPPPRTQTKNFVYPAISPIMSTNSQELVPTNLTNNQPSASNSTEAFPQNTNGSPSVVTASDADPVTASATNSPTPSTPPSTQAIGANPFPSPPWYPESAHFVRQWWPTLIGVPRVSCTVILMAAHDQETHQTRYAFAQHYFKVPFNTRDFSEIAEASSLTNGKVPVNSDMDPLDAHMMKMWYVSTPFEVVSVNDGTDDEVPERLRPLVAVDFGHATWVEYRSSEADRATGTSELSEAKCLRFVTFPPMGMGMDVPVDEGMTEGVVRTLELPDDLDLNYIETINIDQSQGAVILSSQEGKIFFLFYT